MNRKSIIIACGVAGLLCAGLAFYLLRSTGRNYTSALPADARAVACFDAKALLTAADLAMSDMGDLIKHFTEVDSESPGIDMTNPIYGFVDANGNMGALAALCSADDLKKTLEKLHEEGSASEMTQQRGLSWCVVEGQWLIGFDDDKAVAMGPATGEALDQLRNTVATLLQQDRDDSGAKAQLTALTEKGDAPLSATLTADMLPKDMQQELMNFLKIEDINNIFVRMQLAMKDNAITLSADLPEPKKAVSERLDEADQLMRPINGDLTTFSHTNSIAWICLNLNGKDVLKQLREMPGLRPALVAISAIVDIEAMLGAIDGDVALDVPDAAMMTGLLGGTPPLMLTARLANEDFLDQKGNWMNSAAKSGAFRLNATSATDFALSSGDFDMNFGTHDRILYVNTSSRLGTSGDGHAAWGYLADHKNKINGLRFYAAVNVGPLAELASAFTSDDMATSLLDKIKYVEITMPKTGRIELSIIGEEGTNIARSLFSSLTN